MRAGVDRNSSVGSSCSDQNLEKTLQQAATSLVVRGAVCEMSLSTMAMTLARNGHWQKLFVYPGFLPHMKHIEHSSRSSSRIPLGSAPAASGQQNSILMKAGLNRCNKRGYSRWHHVLAE